YYTPHLQIPLTISNRSGNGPANLKVGVWRTDFHWSESSAQVVTLTLIAPDGTRYALNGVARGQASFTTVNISDKPANGTWKLEALFPVHVPAWKDKYAEIAHFTMEFTP